MKNYHATLAFISIICLALTGCDSTYQRSVVVTADAPQLEVFNDTKTSVFFLAIETETSARINLADPCGSFQPNLSAGSKITIPYEEIMGMDKNAESVWVFWTDCKSSSDAQTVSLF